MDDLLGLALIRTVFVLSLAELESTKVRYPRQYVRDDPGKRLGTLMRRVFDDEVVESGTADVIEGVEMIQDRAIQSRR